MSADPPEPNAEAIEEAAAAWLARRDRGFTRDEQDAYLQWLRERPAHGRAIAQVERAWRRLDAMDELPAACTRLPDLDGSSPAVPETNRKRRFVAGALAAAAALAVLAWVAPWKNLTPATATPVEHHVTAKGEFRKVVLGDGSVLELNTDTELAIEIVPETRSLRLLRGEAYFTVAKDPARPFVVWAGSVAVRAVGTAFSVHHDADAVEVLVTEGRVALGAGASTERMLTAGQGAQISLHGDVVSLARVTSASHEERARSLAWRDGRLEFFDHPLPEIVAAFNRYNRHQVVIVDPALGDVRLGGGFRTDNVEVFLELLRSAHGISVERVDDERTFLRRAAAP